MKVYAIQAGSDRGPGHGMQATPATILFGREKAHPVDLAQRAQRVMERR